jgi:membrane fusion protein (multidrug efflux system)
VLVRLDGVAAGVAVAQARAELAEAVRRVAAQFKQLELLKLRLGEPEAAPTTRQLTPGHGAAKRAGRDADPNIRNARAELDVLQAQLHGTTPATHPSVLKAKEALRKAYLEHRRKDVVAPVSGYVAKRRAQLGELVAPGAPLLVIVPLDHLWVEANVKETQLARVRPGQPAEIRVDSLGSGVIYHGVVEGLSPGTGSVFSLLPPEYAAGNYIHVVERVPVRVALSADELAANPLRPGLSTFTRIDISAPGDSVLQSKARLGGPAYRTDTYDSELKDVDGLIEAVVSENLTSR